VSLDIKNLYRSINAVQLYSVAHACITFNINVAACGAAYASSAFASTTFNVYVDGCILIEYCIE
jgi:hypothetical protein